MSAISFGWRHLLNAYGGEGLVWLIGAVDVFASCNRGFNCPLARAMDGCIALQHQLLPINYHFRDCKARCTGLPY